MLLVYKLFKHLYSFSLFIGKNTTFIRVFLFLVYFQKFIRSGYTLSPYGTQRFACMCSSGLGALYCPFSTKFLRSIDLRFTTSPAIVTYTLLCLRCFFSDVGLFVVRVVQRDRHTLCQALVLAWAGVAWQCVWLLAFGI